ncbi:hypothetical protein IR083_10510 [Dysgonomonas sp. GY75]|uniref:hypothetical protein n=1 Tax=Dysgonomonas sp. GY75 TaxID=2780419 RepID=UPI0018839F28|nr:hypothetical protein [Dysgonomonas sp. GY75]MBF0649252.1 hypothetical protein [Dysgonomonas sp. GY75]
MQIEFLGPVYHTSQNAVNAFTDILNMILLSDNIVELNRNLLQRDRSGKLSAHFTWSFADYTFSVWQRAGSGSDICFGHKLIELQFVTLVCKDRRRPDITVH